jgi:hypothetical protein
LDLESIKGVYSVFYFFIIEAVDIVDAILPFLQLIAFELNVLRVEDKIELFSTLDIFLSLISYDFYSPSYRKLK